MIPRSPRIPLWIKLAYTAFMAVMIPIYLKNYGPTNFLYFCDVAAVVTLVAMWIENSLLLSAMLICAFVPQMLWVADFLCQITGFKLTGMTGYMFKPPYFLRFLSFFHFWLIFLIIYLVWRLGYDRRALALWLAIAWVLLTVSYVWMPPASPTRELALTPPVLGASTAGLMGSPMGQGPLLAVSALFPPRPLLRDPNLPVNINYVYNIASDEKPQEWMDQDLYFALYLAIQVIAIYLPTHLLFSCLMPGPKRPKAI